jgi:hypothetical protein
LHASFGGRALAFAALWILSCQGGGGSSPTSPLTVQLSLQAATVSVGGQVVNGMTLPRGHGNGSSTRFEASLVDLGGMPMAGVTVTMSYQRPGSMGMMGTSGTLHLYDDGTHGDRTPGDGVFCYEDSTGDYGCHAADAPMGQYHYEFWGDDAHGHQSNRMAVTVTID